MATKLVISGTNTSAEPSPTLEQLLQSSDGSVVLSPEMQEQLKAMLAKQGEKEVKKAKKSTTRKTKDPNAPKRPTTAYMRFLNASREQIIADHFTDGDGECTLTGRDKVTQVAKKGGEIWSNMSEDEKKPFVDAAEQAKAEYAEAKNEYVPSDPLPVEAEQPDAPEGWSGPYPNTYLRGLVKGHRKQYERFSEAVAAAEELGAEVCGGITKSDKNGKYSLRKAGEGGPRQMEEACVSWVFGEAIMLAPKPKTPSVDESTEAAPKTKVAPKKVAPKKAAPKKAPKLEVQEDEVELDVAGGPAADDTYNASTDNDEDVEISNDDVEIDGSDNEGDDEEDGDSTDVSVIEFDGKDYLLNPSTNEVYDFDMYQQTEQVVTIGSYDPATEKVTLC